MKFTVEVGGKHKWFGPDSFNMTYNKLAHKVPDEVSAVQHQVEHTSSSHNSFEGRVSP
jgi:hypothetical protein